MENPEDEKHLSAFQLKERKERTVFVGNISLECTLKQLKKYFKSNAGPVEKVWFRSIATTQDTKMPERAKILTSQHGPQKDSKNGYVLFKAKETIEKALVLNQTQFMEKHIRVDVLKSDQENAKPVDDFNTTVFVGNLPFVVSEEEVRTHFAKFGAIKNVRIVRDPKTFIGKGIGFVMFSTQDELRAAIKDGTKFKGRELRLKKATDPKKREKKANRKEAALEMRKEKRRLAKKADAGESDSEADNLPKKLEEYSSEDSDDEKIKKLKLPKVVDLEAAPKQIAKMVGKLTHEDKELKIQNIISFNQRKRQSMLKEMINSAQGKGKHTKMADSNAQKKAHNEMFKNEPTKFKKVIAKRIDEHKKKNLQKINKIRVKSKKI